MRIRVRKLLKSEESKQVFYKFDVHFLLSMNYCHLLNDIFLFTRTNNLTRNTLIENYGRKTFRYAVDR